MHALSSGRVCVVHVRPGVSPGARCTTHAGGSPTRGSIGGNGCLNAIEGTSAACGVRTAVDVPSCEDCASENNEAAMRARSSITGADLPDHLACAPRSRRVASVVGMPYLGQ